MSKLTADEKIVLDHFLKEYPLDSSYIYILHLIVTEDDEVTINGLYNDLSKGRLICAMNDLRYALNNYTFTKKVK
jgi:hypothetical protein